MRIFSSAFGNNYRIPDKFTCRDRDINPDLKFSDIPEDTQSLALIVDDPDAPAGSGNPGWVHWLVYNINPSINSIAQNSVPDGSTQGQNDWGRNDWGGPCPPSGTHHYVFTVYALDKKFNLKSGLTKSELLEQVKDHIIESAKLIGLVSA